MGIEASACTLAAELSADACMNLTFHAATQGDGFKGMAHADLGQPRKLIAVEVTLQPPVAPIFVRADSIHPNRNGAVHEPYPIGSAMLWNLPALGTMSARIPIDGPEVEYLHLGLPDSTVIQSVSAFIRHRRLFFPAEAGQTYFLHTGGLAKAAPGSLGELPASSRAFYAGTALAVGAPEPDSQAVVATPDPAARVRPFLPWAVGLLILLGAFWGFRLLRRPDPPALH